jgi:hypothetical protein
MDNKDDDTKERRDFFDAAIEKIKREAVLRCIVCRSKAICVIANVGFCYVCRNEWNIHYTTTNKLK